MTDTITEAVLDQFRTRAEAGKSKYGVTMEKQQTEVKIEQPLFND
jgi:hypothetical protein